MRKTKDVTIEFDNRDKGKRFLITEMSAPQAEDWALRALFALGKTNVDIPERVQGLGMAVLALFGLRALFRIEYGEARVLFDEMMRCVEIYPNPTRTDIKRALVMRGTDGDDIEEAATLAFLKSEVFELHTGFSLADALFSQVSAEAETSSPSST